MVSAERSTEAADVLAEVAATGLLADGPVLVMLSGGRDSVCLLDLAVRIAGREQVAALHVNYGLREAAEADEQCARALCDQLGVELTAVAAGPAPAQGNLQDWARRVRYGAAASAVRERGGAVAAGHTASDQVETVLYRLCASPGRRALRAMALRSGPLVRPLLGLTRAQTTAYCSTRGLTYRDDELNQDERFARVRIREQVIPALSSVHPAAFANVLDTAEQLRDEGELVDGLVAAELDRGPVTLAQLRAMAPSLRRLVVRELAERAAGEPVPQAGQRADEIAALSERVAALDVGGGVRARVEAGTLTFVPSEGRAARADGTHA